MVIGFCKLKEKEVINICDGKRLGYISDIDIDLCTGRVLRLLIPKGGKCLSFTGSKHPICISWQNIERIGEDAILVRFAELPSP